MSSQPDQIRKRSTVAFSAAPARSGRGQLELRLVDGRTVTTRAEASNPLKWLLPRRPTPAAWVYASTFGGGLLAGDQIDMQVGVRSGASAVMSTQSSTKVYRSPAGATTTQTLNAHVDDDALLVMAPDPVTCFAGARYEQRQIIHLMPRANLVYVDWLTSGRRARGERWKFAHYQSRLDIYRNSQRLLTDALKLSPEDGPLDSPYRMGDFNCYAMLILSGERLEAQAEALLQDISNQPVSPGNPVVDAASPLTSGVLWRIAGQTTEQVSRLLTARLAFLSDFLGDTPWARKW
ncbi:MAG: urease accessory protein UreD [Planctomycetaceae bacterium]